MQRASLQTLFAFYFNLIAKRPLGRPTVQAAFAWRRFCRIGPGLMSIKVPLPPGALEDWHVRLCRRIDTNVDRHRAQALCSRSDRFCRGVRPPADIPLGCDAGVLGSGAAVAPR